jgi:hypothetical protein
LETKWQTIVATVHPETASIQLSYVEVPGSMIQHIAASRTHIQLFQQRHSHYIVDKDKRLNTCVHPCWQILKNRMERYVISCHM